jgi:gamma-glutamyltranspeptidase/glutathione hydrolase
MNAAGSELQARPDLHGSFGMCATTHWIATATAQSVLERGGNAFDAAVAAAFVLHIVEPHLNGPGGDLVALVAAPGEGPVVLAGQGPAPERATIEHFTSQGLDLVPGAGALAAAVPGAVDAWLLLLRDKGTWRLGEVLEYAIHYASCGHRISVAAGGVISTVTTLFRQHWPTSAECWLVDGRAPQPGDIVVNTDYATTLRRLVAAAVGEDREAEIEAVRLEWRVGFVAEAIERFVGTTPHRHSTGGDHLGVLRADDMARFRATWETPVSTVFRGVTVFKAGPWSQGPVLLQALQILSGFEDSELDLDSAPGIHHSVEAMKLAMADRDAYYGSAMAPQVLPTLLSADYAACRRRLIADTASRSLRPGGLDVPAYQPPLGVEGGNAPGVGEPTVEVSGSTRGDTCHIDVVDRWGNMISATPSGGWLQSSPTVTGLGFCLGTRLQMTWLDPASPSALRPGTRPRTTLSPTLLGRGDQVVTALGTPGGDQQDQWQLCYLLRTLVGSATPQEAIEAPMFHTTSFAQSFWPRHWTPGGLVIEDRAGREVITDLMARGHVVTQAGGWTLGRLSAVGREPGSAQLWAAANPRGAQGYAAGR